MELNMKENGHLCVQQQCPICQKRFSIELTKEEGTAFLGYQMGFGLLQDALPEMPPAEREFLKTGYCPACQELLFGNGKSNRIIACN